MDIQSKHNINIIEPTNPIGTIVFANGFGTDQTIWNDVVTHFKDRYKIVLFENMGSSKSDLNYYSPNKYDSLYMYSRDLIEICKKLHLKNSILVGHSVGGMIGLLAAVKDPSLFSRLIMIGSSPRYLNDTNYIGGFDTKDLEGLFESMRNNYFAWVSGFAQAAMNTPDKPQLSEYFAKSLGAIQPDIAVSVARTIFYSDHRNDLPKVKIPTLIMKTKEDIAVPSEVPDYMSEKIAGSKKVQINAKGHFPHLSSPTEIIAVLEDYLPN